MKIREYVDYVESLPKEDVWMQDIETDKVVPLTLYRNDKDIEVEEDAIFVTQVDLLDMGSGEATYKIGGRVYYFEYLSGLEEYIGGYSYE